MTARHVEQPAHDATDSRPQCQRQHAPLLLLRRLKRRAVHLLLHPRKLVDDDTNEQVDCKERADDEERVEVQRDGGVGLRHCHAHDHTHNHTGAQVRHREASTPAACTSACDAAPGALVSLRAAMHSRATSLHPDSVATRNSTRNASPTSECQHQRQHDTHDTPRHTQYSTPCHSQSAHHRSHTTAATAKHHTATHCQTRRPQSWPTRDSQPRRPAQTSPRTDPALSHHHTTQRHAKPHRATSSHLSTH
jgi:hypothetical protein